MKVTEKGHTKVIQIGTDTIAGVLQKITAQYQALFMDYNLVIDLSGSQEEVTEDKLEAIEELAIEHMEEANKSFVIVTEAVNFNDFDGDLIVVPTKQEAFDLIEMDEIQRDLEL
ncbi:MULTISPECIES: ribonuclease Z [unclassified Myroides]|uniref:ribonuclease Z n=1 Tax=unclassified Myroides TaxID=2642485 RepID=UPI0015F8D59D|nr:MULTISPECIES: ribonuclease Z [unclassified Myroides]MBB1150742.1 ribonuclease Z [Myroides sp. NP-2]MDM1407575.1 ribonuclease Z [Myroides sp. DF42-4-2]